MDTEGRAWNATAGTALVHKIWFHVVGVFKANTFEVTTWQVALTSEQVAELFRRGANGLHLTDP